MPKVIGKEAKTRRSFQLLAVLALMVLGVTILLNWSAGATIQPASNWTARYDGTRSSWHSRNLPLSTSGNSWDIYNLAYGIDSEVAMFETTGQKTYLDRALLYTNNLIGTARVSSSIPTSQYKDSYYGWTSKSTISQHSTVNGKEVPLFESYGWRYVTRMLRVMHSSPELMADPLYRSQYDKVLAFSERNMFEKWYGRGQGNIYRQNTHMAAHWAYMALELSAITTDQAKKSRYVTVFNNVNTNLPNYSTDSGLRGQLKPFPDTIIGANGYWWDFNWGQSSRPGSDVNHANGVISFVVEAVDAKRYWTRADALKFARPMTEVLMPKRSYYVDGTGSGNGWLNDGYVKLGRYDPSIQLKLETHSPQGAQFFAAMALNAKILTSPPESPQTRKGDLNGDARVDITDLSVLLSAWGPGRGLADLNGDGGVGITDLSILLTAWASD